MSSDKDAVALRQEWEQLQAAAIEDSHRRNQLELQRRDDVEAKATQLRDELGVKLVALMENLESYVDGTQGEVTAAMVSVYVKAAHELAMLYGLTRGPRPLTLPLPVPEPAAVLGHEEEQSRRVAAVEAARAAGLAQLEAVRLKMRPQLEAS
jgi:hypothetical protein